MQKNYSKFSKITVNNYSVNKYINIVYSIDEIRFSGEIQKSKYDDLKNFCFEKFGKPKENNQPNHFLYMFKSCEIGTSTVRIKIGRNMWFSKKNGKIYDENQYEFEIVFNPNKSMRNEKEINQIYEILISLLMYADMQTVAIKKCDVALDLPFCRESVHFDTKIEESANYKGTEYADGLKIYDKAEESHLNEELTRVELRLKIGNNRDLKKMVKKIKKEFKRKYCYVTLPNKPLTKKQKSTKIYKKHKELIDTCRCSYEPMRVLNERFKNAEHNKLSASEKSKDKEKILKENLINVRQVTDYIDDDVMLSVFDEMFAYFDGLFFEITELQEKNDKHIFDEEYVDLTSVIELLNFDEEEIDEEEIEEEINLNVNGTEEKW